MLIINIFGSVHNGQLKEIKLFFADKVYDEHLFVALKGELGIISESYNIINYKEITKEEYDLYKI